MRSKPIKILQISNLLVTEAGGDAIPVLEEMATYLERETGAVDYIVVCGNITASRSQIEFEVARRLLRRLAQKILVRDTGEGEARLDRIVVIPGRNDVDEEAENPLAAFGEFCMRLYQSESNIPYGSSKELHITTFDPDGVVYRDLKDLTIISVLYWNASAERNRQRLEKLVEALKRKVIQQRPWYCHFTPTVVCSADSPFDEQNPHTDLEAVNHLFTQVRVELQLLGAPGRVVLLPQPDRLDPLGLTTGRSTPEFWPFRGNLLELRAGPPMGNGEGYASPPAALGVEGPFSRQANEGNSARPDGDCSQEPLLSLWRLVKDSPTNHLTCVEHITDGRLDRWIEPLSPEPRSGRVIARYLEQIEEKLARFRFVVVSGLAGSGKSDLYEHISQECALATQSFHVACVSIHTYKPDRVIDQFQKAAEDLSTDCTEPRLLLVRDCFYHLLPANERSKSLPGVLASCRDFLDRRAADFIIYFVGRADRADFSRDGITIAELKPIPRQELAPLVRDYGWRIPIADTDLYPMTGGYVGLSRLVLNEAARHFGDYDGAEPVGLSTGSVLVRNAVRQTGKAHTEAKYLRDDLRRRIGDHIFFFLEKRIAPTDGREDTDPITFEKEALEAGVGKAEFFARHVDLLDSGIASFEDGVYTVEVRAPFLVSFLEDRGNAPPPTIPSRVAAAPTAPTARTLDAEDWRRLYKMAQRVGWDDIGTRRIVWQTVFPESDLLKNHPNAATAARGDFEVALLHRVQQCETRTPLLRLIELLRREKPFFSRILDDLLAKLGEDEGATR